MYTGYLEYTASLRYTESRCRGTRSKISFALTWSRYSLCLLSFCSLYREKGVNTTMQQQENVSWGLFPGLQHCPPRESGSSFKPTGNSVHAPSKPTAGALKTSSVFVSNRDHLSRGNSHKRRPGRLRPGSSDSSQSPRTTDHPSSLRARSLRSNDPAPPNSSPPLLRSSRRNRTTDKKPCRSRQVHTPQQLLSGSSPNPCR